MKMQPSISTTALWLALTTSFSTALPNNNAQPAQFKHWPADAAATLNAMIAKNANQGNYAVFDMDQTSYRWDLEESLIPFMENKGVLTRDKLDPSLKLIDFKDTANFTETLYSYYLRLCEVDDFVCYPWSAQVWSGFKLSELKGYVDELMACNDTIPTRYWSEGRVVDAKINRPVVYPGQVELYTALQANGIAVYVVSAAHEELVRFVASDPKYGYNVPPQNVIGVTTMLKNKTSGELTNARKQIAAGKYNQAANLDLIVTPYLWTPATWFAGKWAAILTYIDQWKRPVLVAGDTPGSDSYMLFHGVDTSKGGVHVWVNRKEAYLTKIQGEIKNNTEAQQKYGREVTADKNWVFVRPADIL